MVTQLIRADEVQDGDVIQLDPVNSPVAIEIIRHHVHVHDEEFDGPSVCLVREGRDEGIRRRADHLVALISREGEL